jgi:hypothetical protein
MNFSRRGGTKLLNYAGASGRETCISYARLTPKEKGEAHYGGASLFYLTCTKKTANRIFSMG